MTPEREVHHLKQASADQLCDFLAAKVRSARKDRGESQAVFAERAGIPLRTYKRLETHGQGHLMTFVKALMALECAHLLTLAFPQRPGPSKPGSVIERLKQLQAQKN